MKRMFTQEEIKKLAETKLDFSSIPCIIIDDFGNEDVTISNEDLKIFDEIPFVVAFYNSGDDSIFNMIYLRIVEKYDNNYYLVYETDTNLSYSGKLIVSYTDGEYSLESSSIVKSDNFPVISLSSQDDIDYHWNIIENRLPFITSANEVYYSSKSPSQDPTYFLITFNISTNSFSVKTITFNKTTHVATSSAFTQYDMTPHT